MKEKFEFVLSEEELKEYIYYIFALNPKNQRRCIWMKFSIPVFLGFTVYFFKVYNNVIVVTSAIAVAIIWLLVLSKLLWRLFLEKQVYNWYKNYEGKTQYTKVHVEFDDEKITLDGKEIVYANLVNIVPLKHVLIFVYKTNQIFLLPVRVISDMESFSKNINKKREEVIKETSK